MPPVPGTGRWSEAAKVRVCGEGKAHGGHRILPGERRAMDGAAGMLAGGEDSRGGGGKGQDPDLTCPS